MIEERYQEIYHYRYVNQIPLRDTQPALLVNWCELTLTKGSDGSVIYRNAFITRHEMQVDNVVEVNKRQRGFLEGSRGENPMNESRGFKQGCLVSRTACLEPNFSPSPRLKSGARLPSGRGKGNSFPLAPCQKAPLPLLVIAAGRARWKVENENNNVFKTKGYHLEHNFGHGQKHLSSILVTLNLLAFLFHTVLQLVDQYYQQIRLRRGARKTFFNDIRTLTTYLLFDSWQHLIEFMLSESAPWKPHNTS